MGKTVILTGTSSGMGNIAARTLAGKGHRIFATMRDITGKNAAAAAELDAIEGIDVVELDVSNDPSVAAGIGRIMERVPHIDALINGAAICAQGLAEAFTADQFLQMLNTNTVGPLRLCKAVLPHMRKRGEGLLITITSLMGRMVIPGSTLYSATKFGLEALVEGLAQEVCGLGVESVIIEPGAFATNLMANPVIPKDQHVAKDYGDFAAPQDVMNAAIGPMLARTGASIDPQLVADLLADLIVMRAGTRPFRVTVGLDMGLSQMNDAVEPYQADVLEQLDLQVWNAARHLARAATVT